MEKNFKKIPKKILIQCADIKYYPTIVSEIDFMAKDTKYDLLICVGKRLRLNIAYPFSIADSEIWFERGDALTKEIFEKALKHYSECEIRNGV